LSAFLAIALALACGAANLACARATAKCKHERLNGGNKAAASGCLCPSTG
jgi:hypothetical protein